MLTWVTLLTQAQRLLTLKIALNSMSIFLISELYLHSVKVGDLKFESDAANDAEYHATITAIETKLRCQYSQYRITCGHDSTCSVGIRMYVDATLTTSDSTSAGSVCLSSRDQLPCLAIRRICS